MIARSRAVIELVLACAAFAGALLSWAGAHHTVTVAPIADGHGVVRAGPTQQRPRESGAGQHELDHGPGTGDHCVGSASSSRSASARAGSTRS